MRHLELVERSLHFGRDDVEFRVQKFFILNSSFFILHYFHTNPSWLMRHTVPSVAGSVISNSDEVRSTVSLPSWSAEQRSLAFSVWADAV